MILREYLEGTPVAAAAPLSPPAEAPSPAPRAAGAAGQPRITLIIGGGIAAYKALDLIRRLKERHIACPLRADQGGAAIRHAAGGQRAVA